MEQAYHFRDKGQWALRSIACISDKCPYPQSTWTNTLYKKRDHIALPVVSELLSILHRGRSLRLVEGSFVNTVSRRYLLSIPVE